MATPQNNHNKKPKERDPSLLTPAGFDPTTGAFVYRSEDVSVIQRLQNEQPTAFDTRKTIQLGGGDDNNKKKQQQHLERRTTLWIFAGVVFFFVVVAIVVLIVVVVLKSRMDSSSLSSTTGRLTPDVPTIAPSTPNGVMNKSKTPTMAPYFVGTDSPSNAEPPPRTRTKSPSPTLSPSPATSILAAAQSPFPSAYTSCFSFCQDNVPVPQSFANVVAFTIGGASFSCSYAQDNFQFLLSLLDTDSFGPTQESCLDGQLIGALRCGCPAYPLRWQASCPVYCDSGQIPVIRQVWDLADSYFIQCTEEIRKVAAMSAMLTPQECQERSTVIASSCGCP